MTMRIGFDDGRSAEFATNSGYADFAAWVEQQDRPQLRHLVEYGWCQDLPALLDELHSAKPPALVTGVAQTLADLLVGTTGAIIITDGMAPTSSP